MAQDGGNDTWPPRGAGGILADKLLAAVRNPSPGWFSGNASAPPTLASLGGAMGYLRRAAWPSMMAS